ncbi:Basic helix-loop-helix DNA-binding superfamily protein, putative isoform 2 [Hibiscus syriacus]|uniref:Basic helix-loop-helix DNA-binding superfamily protein, putative isoform 2 n=1 Tax=Hibiscus syriacus TaxID=106335 RepID=A0A6A3A985_HIBSY|nr:putative transcription factor bHLH107 [Hibiscus syriacus]KAE8700536.1 Basic helix-loop-helix DNA-binding superfamily protein, putative isoform 2 [Hibiscus syriacus]
MAAYSFNNFSSGNCYSSIFDPFSLDLGPYNGSSRGGSLSVSVSQSLVLDSEKEELVKDPLKVGKKTVPEEKITAALKSHSDAERRRRERINAHLDTLRTLLPCKQKMDKATLLGEVIKQLKELKNNETEASKGLFVPMDDDEVSVEPCSMDEADGMVCFKASICCDYRHQLLTDLRRALDALPFQIKFVKSEISTLGSRLKNDFVFTTGCRSSSIVDDDGYNTDAWRFIACSIRQALDSVLEKASTSLEFAPLLAFPNKRRSISYIDSSNSSSCSKKD